MAISPIINGQAIKGPTAKMMAELGLPVDSAGIAMHYGNLIDALVVDHSDSARLPDTGPRIFRAATLMHSEADKRALAGEVLSIAKSLGTNC